MFKKKNLRKLILRHMVYEHMYTSVYAPCLPTEF